MTTDHLARAKDYIAKGDEYYEKAADEILAAMEADSELTQVAVAERLGKSQVWVSRVISARIEGRAVDHASGSNKRDEVTTKTLAKANVEQVREIVASLPTEAVERVMHSTTSELGNRNRPVPRGSAKEPRSVERRLNDAVWQFWLIQDELQDAPIDGDVRVRMLGVIQSGRTFLDAIESRLEHGDIDDELAALLNEARPS